MSQVFNGSSGGGGGLTSVATDATLDGDGTAGNPLAVANPYVPYAPSMMTAFLPSTGIMLTSPFTAYPMMGGAYIEEIATPDFDITGSAIRPLFDGVMKITVQFTLMAMPVGSDASVQITAGLCDALLPAPVGLMQSSDTCYIDNGLDALQSVRFTYAIQCQAGTLYHPYLVTTGDVVDWELLGDEGRTTIIAERIA